MSSNLPGLDDVARHGHIFRRGSRIARRMVVRDDDGGGVAADGFAKQLGHANDRGVETAHVDRGHGQHAIARVEQHHAQVLLLQHAHLAHQQVGRIGGRSNLNAIVRRGDRQAAAQFKRGFQRGDFGFRPGRVLLADR